MKAREKKRRYWSSVVARYERSGQSQAMFTTEAGVAVAAFRYWLYRLRRERTAVTMAGHSRGSDEVRLVPVEVRQSPAEGRLDLRTAGLRVLMPIGTDPRYVAHVVAALRDVAAC
jgi:sirohydrochlorin ferrochelatase